MALAFRGSKFETLRAPCAVILLWVQALPGGDIKQLPLELSNLLGALPPPRSLTGSQVLS
jgi:hypothetical protein